MFNSWLYRFIHFQFLLCGSFWKFKQLESPSSVSDLSEFIRLFNFLYLLNKQILIRAMKNLIFFLFSVISYLVFTGSTYLSFQDFGYSDSVLYILVCCHLVCYSSSFSNLLLQPRSLSTAPSYSRKLELYSILRFNYVLRFQISNPEHCIVKANRYIKISDEISA